MTVLVTGAAGFIGYHVSSRLIQMGIPVVGIDNMNHYYDPLLKHARIAQLNLIAKQAHTDFILVESDIIDEQVVHATFSKYKPSSVINLAAQAGVRHSINNPQDYIQSNIVGFCNILEACQAYSVDHILYASSSSVYGGNTNIPYSEKHGTDHPLNLYAATKKANELLAHTYSSLYGIPATGMRFFTVYGPWGRPDMALFLFTKAILNRLPIQVFNNGDMQRAFTYIDDVVDSILLLLDKPPTENLSFNTSLPDPSTSWAPHRILNIGNPYTVPLMEYINAIETALGIDAIKDYLPIQPGDAPKSAPDIHALEQLIGYKPNTPIKEGVGKFVTWYRQFYSV